MYTNNESVLVYELPAIEPVESFYRISELFPDAECKAFVSYHDLKIFVDGRKTPSNPISCTVYLLLIDVKMNSVPYTFTVEIVEELCAANLQDCDDVAIDVHSDSEQGTEDTDANPFPNTLPKSNEEKLSDLIAQYTAGADDRER